MPPYNPGKGFTKGKRNFGRQFHPIEKKWKGHAGDDWPAKQGTPIPAAYDGVVSRVDFQYNKKTGTGWGWYVDLVHTVRGQKVLTRYAHMPQRSHLSAKQSIKKGEPVGQVGSSGGSTGPHLHFEVRIDGVAVDPSAFDFPGDGAGDSAGEGEGEATGATTGPWAYPFDASDTKASVDGGLYTGVSAGREGALGRGHSGFYPIGANGLWHGGIHFDAGTGTLLNQRGGVLCIHDGEVVAYLVNKKYPEAEFTPSKKKAAYSTGFTLVRHRLELPEEKKPADKKADSDKKADAAKKPEPAAKPAKEPLVFYSLYMHQLDWKGYQDEPKRPRPGYWGESKKFRVGQKAKDRQEAAAPARPSTAAVSPLDLDNLLAGEAGGMCSGDQDDDDELVC
jgi:murein DD-endopeptidase MepM/ murein hydrolase activator NlpD